MRKFKTGATRDSLDGKPQYHGYFSPVAFRLFGEYMLKHQRQADGTMRTCDNWKKGIDLPTYLDSLWRHFMDLWEIMEGGHPTDIKTGEPIDWKEAWGGLYFNLQGIAHEKSKAGNDLRPYG